MNNDESVEPRSSMLCFATPIFGAAGLAGPLIGLALWTSY
jgi:hypothetical protein